MPTIHRYTRTVIKPRATADTANRLAVSQATAPFELGAGIAEFGAEIARREKQAHDATKLNERVISYKKDLLEMDDRLRLENSETPEGYAGLFEGKSKELKEQYKKEFADKNLEKLFDETATNYNFSRFDDALTYQRRQGAVVAGNRVESATNNLAVQAYRGVAPDELTNDLDATIAAASTVVGREQLNQVSNTSMGTIAASYIEGLVDRGEYGSAEEVLNSKKYDDALGVSRIDAFTTKINNKRKAELTQKVKTDYSIFNSIYENGGPYSEEDARKLESLAVASGNEAVAKDVRMKMDIKPVVDEFIQMPSSDQSSALASAQNDFFEHKTPKSALAFNEIMKAAKRKSDAISSGNAFQYYQDVGVIEKFPPMDFSRPDNVVQSYGHRKAAQNVIAEKDGIRVPLFTKQEASSLVATYEQLPNKQKASYLSSITGTLGGTDSQDLAAIISPESPELAGVIAIMNEDPVSAGKAIIGSEREKFVGRKEVSIALQSKYANAVRDPQALTSLVYMMHSLYTEETHNKDAPDVFDEDVFEDVAERVLGEPINIGDDEVLPFRKTDNQFISEGEFQNLLVNTSIDFLEKTFGDVPHIGGRPANDDELQEMINHWSLVTVGDGQYEIRNSNNFNQVVLDSKNRPYVFDYKYVLNTGGVDTDGMLTKGWKFISSAIGEATRPIPKGE